MSKPRFKLDNNILLHMALEHLKLSKKQWSQRCYQRLNLGSAVLLNRDMIETPSGRSAHIANYSTPTHVVQTTDYGRVRMIEARNNKRENT